MPRFTDLTGKVFGELTVLERAEDLILKSGKPRTMWKCKCSCGTIKDVSGQSLTQGTTVSCGCIGRQRRLDSQSKRVGDLAGQRFGRLLVVSRAETVVTKTGQKKTMWNCMCDCGKSIVTSRTSLVSGRCKSCGCYRIEETIKRESVDITGNKYGYLTAIKRVGSRKYANVSASLWLCQCECGKQIVLPYSHVVSGHTQSCGCIGSSKGEKDIEKWLTKNDIAYRREKTFRNLKSSKNNRLRFDFCIYDYSGSPVALIEYQGLQHYVELPKYPKFGALQRNETDALKREYCSAHRIPLYEISCFEDTIKQLESIISQLRAKQIL